MPNKSSALARYLENLATQGVNLNSIYATAAHGEEKAVVVYAAEAEVEASIAKLGTLSIKRPASNSR